MNDLLVTYFTNGAGNNVPKNLSEFIHENIDLQALNRVLSEENLAGTSVGHFLCPVKQSEFHPFSSAFHITVPAVRIETCINGAYANL
jgi:hypothetical protein